MGRKGPCSEAILYKAFSQDINLHTEKILIRHVEHGPKQIKRLFIVPYEFGSDWVLIVEVHERAVNREENGDRVVE